MKSLSMHSRVAILFMVGLVVSATGRPAEAKSRRNVLLLIGDDHGGGDLGCYGHPLLKTPHLDRLAADGVRFSHAFATTASCSASRSVIYTGLHNHKNGQYGHAHAESHFVQQPFVETIFTLLRANGYRTGLIGKKHVLPEEKYRVDFEPKANPRDVAQVAELSGEFFRSSGERPFLLVIGFVDPHRTGNGFGNERKHRGEIEVRYDCQGVPVPHFLPDSPEVRAELAEYLQAISRMDQTIGRVLQALEHSGNADETLVLYTSDNGMPFPGAKTNVYDPGIHLPLIVRRPELRRRGLVNQAMISWVDFAPTILDWTGTKAPARYSLHGRSFLPVLEVEKPVGWDEVYASHTFHEITMYYPMRAVRTRKTKFIWNIAAGLKFPHASDLFASSTWQSVLLRDAEMLGSRSVTKYLHRDEYELYDLEKDPRELVNRANDPAYAALRKELAAKLKDFQRKTDDPWIVRYTY